jgi:hypothetical protein
MSQLLVRLFKTVAVTLQFNSELTVILSILLLKKSTKMLANLGKYLRYGKNDLNLDITYQDYQKFNKSSDYFKICELIDKEIAIQKKQFEAAAQTIFGNNSTLLKYEQFNREMKEESVNVEYLKTVSKEYLTLMVNKPHYFGEIA